MHVKVDSNFKGTVEAVGEIVEGKEQVKEYILPGESSSEDMDVDYLIITMPNGRTFKYFLMGAGFLSMGEQPEEASVGASGEVTGQGPVIPIDNWPYFEGKISEAKRARPGRMINQPLRTRSSSQKWLNGKPKRPTYFWEDPGLAPVNSWLDGFGKWLKGAVRSVGG